MKHIPWLITVLVVVLVLPAQAQEKRGGVSASYLVPTGDFKDAADNGVGFGLAFDYNMTSTFDLTLSAARHSFGGRDGADDRTVWEFGGGPQIMAGKLYVGAEYLWFTELDESGFVPNIGMRRGILDVSVRTKVSGDANFYAARVVVFF